MLLAQRLVARRRRLPFPFGVKQTLVQNRAIFEGGIHALPQEWHHRVAGVADQPAPAATPRPPADFPPRPARVDSEVSRPPLERHHTTLPLLPSYPPPLATH